MAPRRTASPKTIAPQKLPRFLERDLDWPYIGNDLFGAIGNRNFAFFRLVQFQLESDVFGDAERDGTGIDQRLGHDGTQVWQKGIPRFISVGINAVG